ncbi:hypothetical protein EDEG_00715 [Edhazardia aedis USNM 41457]|uniref:DNA-directed RNA polymerase RBP11-like dimerisation domain-containing protein n=1 Tax=Edhazardia aedis (strain USNM 41457) TaxID=1003232 RepID=J9DRQ7_EDHAE|nr:hypothetical protein EDEG_00715 [Edhazardia aedis USNM 41457]|eukprot:EJW05250.1 hypothetical protein EDEG_00715 [Edhazardia aedis USNM 41457]
MNIRNNEPKEILSFINDSTVEVIDEDHTLLNPLRYMITKNDHVELVGYSIPHPSERKAQLKIQLKKAFKYNNSIDKIIYKGADDLDKVTEHILHLIDRNLKTLNISQ